VKNNGYTEYTRDANDAEYDLQAIGIAQATCKATHYWQAQSRRPPIYARHYLRMDRLTLEMP